MKKLTPAQLELLKNLSQRSTTCASFWPPAKNLVSLGYAEWRHIGLSDVLSITPAGRKALAEAGERNG